MVCHFWQQFLSQFFLFRMTFLFLSMTALRITNTKLSDRLSDCFNQSGCGWVSYHAEQDGCYHLKEQKKLSQKLVPKMTHHFVEGSLLEKQTVFHKILEGWFRPATFKLWPCFHFINCLVTLGVSELFITGVGSLNVSLNHLMFSICSHTESHWIFISSMGSLMCLQLT